MDVIVVFILLFVLYLIQRKYLIRKYNHYNSKGFKYFFDLLFILHHVFFLIYYLYSTSKSSDSIQFYEKTFAAKSWVEFVGTGTNSIRFLTFPLSRYLHLSFPAVSLIFSFLGLQGMILFFLTANEKIGEQKVFYFNLSLLEILFLLPNCHFWSSSLGKGSIMMFGIALMMFSLSNFRKRFLYFFLSLMLVLVIRPHIVFILLICVEISVLFASNVKMITRLVVASIALLSIFLIADFVSTFIKSDISSVFLENSAIFVKAQLLSNSSSGYDVSNYNQFMKLFTFLFRPLFFDSPNILGIITSIENLTGIFLFIHLFYLKLNSSTKWNNFILFSFIFFLVSSFMLAQVSGNLGIAIRQKAQIMPIFFMVYVKTYMDYLNLGKNKIMST